jgi:hypothetical protein
VTLEAVKAAAAAKAEADRAYREAVVLAAASHSYAAIGAALGVTRQRVHQLVRDAGGSAEATARRKSAGPGERPAERARLEARLAELDQRWQAAVGVLADAYQASDDVRTTPWGREQTEQQWRNAHAGRRRRKGLTGVTVAEELRRNCEAELLRCIEKDAANPVFAVLAAEVDEAWTIRKRLETLRHAGMNDVERQVFAAG